MARFVQGSDAFAALHSPAERVTLHLVREVAADARRFVPVDTGELHASIREAYTGGITGRVYVGTDHWAPTEYGSRAHEIVSHGPWPLRNRETGEVFGRRVWHPGTPEQPFMRPALYQRRRIVT